MIDIEYFNEYLSIFLGFIIGYILFLIYKNNNIRNIYI